ncbi:MAG TPA: peptidoglycan-binding protein [Candidatus Binatia bacterium]
MKSRKELLTAALLSASVGLAGSSLFAQSPGTGSSMPGSQDQSSPSIPRPEPSTPQQPTIPGQPAPGLPQTDPIPGQPGTIPEIMKHPGENPQSPAATSEDIKKAQDALQARGLNPGADGRMDAKTQQALREFQQANDLPVTGDLDQKTAEKLGVNLAVESHPSSGNSSPYSQPSVPLR